MAEAQIQASIWEFAVEPTAVTAAAVTRGARERALAAGQIVTTHKDGRLVQEKVVAGKVVELFNQILERDAE